MSYKWVKYNEILINKIIINAIEVDVMTHNIVKYIEFNKPFGETLFYANTINGGLKTHPTGFKRSILFLLLLQSILN